MTKYQSLIEDFKKAVFRLDEVLKEEKTAIVRDSAIKRFEIAFDLCWKTLKAFLEKEHNAVCVSPKTCFSEAFRMGLIDYDTEWLKMTEDRNYTAHTYKELLAEKVYNDLPSVLSAFKKLLVTLGEQSDSNP